jgi:hypothetical protein
MTKCATRWNRHAASCTYLAATVRTWESWQVILHPFRVGIRGRKMCCGVRFAPKKHSLTGVSTGLHFSRNFLSLLSVSHTTRACSSLDAVNLQACRSDDASQLLLVSFCVPQLTAVSSGKSNSRFKFGFLDVKRILGLV